MIGRSHAEPVSSSEKTEKPAACRRIANLPVLDKKGKPAGALWDRIKPRGKEKATVLAFGAHWCVPCMLEIPTLNWMKRNYKYADRIRVAGIYFIPKREPARVAIRKTERELHIEQMPDLQPIRVPYFYMHEREVWKVLGSGLDPSELRLPKTVLLDRNGCVVHATGESLDPFAFFEDGTPYVRTNDAISALLGHIEKLVAGEQAKSNP